MHLRSVAGRAVSKTARNSYEQPGCLLFSETHADRKPRESEADDLMFCCKKQQKQPERDFAALGKNRSFASLVLRVIHTIHQAMTHHRSYPIPLHRRKPVPTAKVDPGLRRESAEGTSNCIN
jgi:hypothetical protein